MKLIHSLSREELDNFCNNREVSKYRADQIWQWLYRKKVQDFSEMKNIPVDLRDILTKEFSLSSAVLDTAEGEPDTTQKLLATLHDGEQVEEVLIQHRARRTVCVSCQAGCKYACSFCASGQAGFTRNLESGEIIGQLLLAGRISEERINNVVFMGTGEPLDNYDEVLKAIDIINDDKAFGIGARKTTISTCGVIPGIERLTKEKRQTELSVSLHAANDRLRSKLMPVNKKYPLKPLIAACKKYTESTGRIITFEYTLIKGVNDSFDNARELAKLLKPLHCKMNFLLLSPVKEYEGKPSSRDTADIFIQEVKKVGVVSTVRDSRGSKIQAACGQLRYQSS